ncbi:MAG: hypothetical protein R2809_08540 [Flavobacteriales bacterium]
MAAYFILNRKHFLLILFSLFYIGCGKNQQKVEDSYQLEKGMNIDEVIKIMGEPDYRESRKANDTLYSQWKEVFYYNVYTVPLFSDDIIVWFDQTKTVGQVSRPKD